MVSFPNCKINIGLNILRKRDDGYHDIESCFYPVKWHDILEIIPSQKLSFTSHGIKIPGNPDSNLCLEAFRVLKQDFDIPPVDIILYKNVPIGAGLGGGSADASFTLKMLNEMFGLGLGNIQLESYAKKLGSDCPFFVENKPVFAVNTGTEFEPCKVRLTGKHIVLINPGIHISSKEAYSGVSPSIPSNSLLSSLTSSDLQDWKDGIKNDFEVSVFKKYPQIEELKEVFYKAGAQYASMTGSGSTVYGIFDKTPDMDLEVYPSYWQGALN